MKKQQFKETLEAIDEIQEHLIRKRMRSSVPKLRCIRANLIKLKLELDADKIAEHYETHHHD